MARPKLKINPTAVLKMARHGATNCEIADVLGCSEGTIRTRFYESLAKGRSDRKTKLRRKQYEVAIKGNVAMLIWLGKQDLGQKDKQEHQLSGPDGGPIQSEVKQEFDWDAYRAAKAATANAAGAGRIPASENGN